MVPDPFPTPDDRKKEVVIHYLRAAASIFKDWTGEEPSVDGDARDREPIIAIAAMLQAEEKK